MAICTFSWNETPSEDFRHGSVSIGNFDGVHRGHSLLLSELRTQASAVQGPAVAMIFDPHPLQLLRPQQFLPELTTTVDRAELLLSNGADHVLILRTTPELLHLTVEEFFNEVVRRRLDVRVLVEGVNFGFGRNREGDVARLGELCRQSSLGLVIVQPLQMGSVIISSSRVRSALQQGKVSEAAELLGRPYRLRGVVGQGQGRGRTLNFPTANLEKTTTVVPADGVYVVRALWKHGVWPGAANIGPNPTFGEHARKIEVHLIDFEGDLYGEEVAMDFVDFLRPTRPFPTIAELITQLHLDVAQARERTAATAQNAARSPSGSK